MPTYKVRSGEMDEKVFVPYHAQADAICFFALSQMRSKPVKSLGAVTRVAGGKFRGDYVTYLPTEALLRKAGLLIGEEK